MEQLDPDAVARLVAAIIAGTPRLPGAACRQRPDLFDDKHPGETREQHHQRHAAAADLCSR